ncbi:unnamed protein product [Polarella glacialis]|uniref:PARP-type domain-containing protein n=1 Tax=Polarella glacialis TaxID=89957 RepID=A0A813LWZ1_POLGL|nr:unnamed protein product [Polarella glacialis]
MSAPEAAGSPELLEVDPAAESRAAASSGTSSSSGPAPEVVPIYVTVDFDDGPETGLVVEVPEDDFCDPRFWRFQEVHGRSPVYKVLFDAELVAFVTEKPSAAEGVLVDEDGDRHGYIREEQPPEILKAARPKVEVSGGALPAADIVTAEAVRRRSSGGWGHVVVETVDEPEVPGPSKGSVGSTPRRRLKRVRQEDLDWGESRPSKRPSPSQPSRPQQQQQKQQQQQEPLASSVASTKSDSSSARAAPATAGTGTQGDTQSLEVVELQTIGALHAATTSASSKPLAVDSATTEAVTTSAPSSLASEATLAAAAQQQQHHYRQQQQHQQQQELQAIPTVATPAPMMPAAPTTTAPVAATAAATAATTATAATAPAPGSDAAALSNDASGEPEVERAGGFVVERAKTARSKCRVCDQGVAKDAVRAGVPGYAGGRTTTFWAHGMCFLAQLRADYATSRRSLCRGSGQAFVRGELRVGFEVGSAKTWWKPQEAARWTAAVVAAQASNEQQAPPSVRGLESLDTEHREPLLQLLHLGRPSPVELRKALVGGAAAEARRKRAPSAAKAKAKAKAEAGAAAAPEGEDQEGSAPEGEDEDDLDSDVELAVDDPIQPAEAAWQPVVLDPGSPKDLDPESDEDFEVLGADL